MSGAPVDHPLAQAVAAAFEPGGPIARATPELRARPGQLHLAAAVARAVAQGGVLVAEAATGVGKTFAYLVPALLSGERVLLSTATKTLQDQLYGRDLPRLAEALGVPVRTALLKGRASYLCLHRLSLARQSPDAGAPGVRAALSNIERWAQATRTGDLAELPGLDERSPAVPLVTSTRENCLGADCPQFRACHVVAARREALAADVVVINHHLFFADLAIRESGMAELLPTTRVVIFDEAHQLNETGIQFLGRHIATGQLLDFARDMLAAGLQQARGLADWQGAAAALERAARDLRMAVGEPRGGARLRWVGDAPEGVAPELWRAALAALHAALVQAAEALDTVSELSPDFVRLHERAVALAARAERFGAPCDPALVRWVDVALGLRLIESPLDIAETVRTRLLPAAAVAQAHDAARDCVDVEAPPRAGARAGGRSTDVANVPAPPAAADADAPQRAWIFVSATLGDDARLSWFTEPCGLAQVAEVLRIGSPFDYARQAALYVPTHIARPQDPAHSRDVARLAGDIARRLGGRTLVLTTTLRAVRTIGDALAARFGPADGAAGAAEPTDAAHQGHGDSAIDVLVQGQLPKRVLMERFRAAGAEDGDDAVSAATLGAAAPRGRRGCVLVASASFWEGVDLPGDALQAVVIDKLPFPPPGDPLVEARCRRLELEGRSPFSHYSLPEAAVALKQGAGRLIRREGDAGVLVICDTRLLQMSYGRRLIAALPPMRRLASPAEFDAALAALAARTARASDGPSNRPPAPVE